MDSKNLIDSVIKLITSGNLITLDVILFIFEVFSVDWSTDGERVASGGRDRVLKMWRR
jgi:ribosome assembly protein 4